MQRFLAPIQGADAGSNTGLAGAASFKVDVSRGERLGRVSSGWFSRPDDERFLSLPELYAAVRGLAGAAPALRCLAGADLAWQAGGHNASWGPAKIFNNFNLL